MAMPRSRPNPNPISAQEPAFHTVPGQHQQGHGQPDQIGHGGKLQPGGRARQKAGRQKNHQRDLLRFARATRAENAITSNSPPANMPRPLAMSSEVIPISPKAAPPPNMPASENAAVARANRCGYLVGEPTGDRPDSAAPRPACAPSQSPATQAGKCVPIQKSGTSSRGL